MEAAKTVPQRALRTLHLVSLYGDSFHFGCIILN